MDTKSLEMLEFPRIREILAGFTSFSTSRDLAGALFPVQDHGQISRLLQQTAEARGLLDYEGGFSVGGVLDVREKVKIAALEGILDAVSLVEVQQTLTALHELRRYLKGLAEQFPQLWEITEGIAELRQVEKDIGDCLDPAGEVLDTASPALADIRHQLRETRSQILERLEAIVRSSRGQRLLQEECLAPQAQHVEAGTWREGDLVASRGQVIVPVLRGG